jgi:hypothetical protein
MTWADVGTLYGVSLGFVRISWNQTVPGMKVIRLDLGGDLRGRVAAAA